MARDACSAMLASLTLTGEWDSIVSERVTLNFTPVCESRVISEKSALVSVRVLISNA